MPQSHYFIINLKSRQLNTTHWLNDVMWIVLGLEFHHIHVRKWISRVRCENRSKFCHEGIRTACLLSHKQCEFQGQCLPLQGKSKGTKWWNCGHTTRVHMLMQDTNHTIANLSDLHLTYSSRRPIWLESRILGIVWFG